MSPAKTVAIALLYMVLTGCGPSGEQAVAEANGMPPPMPEGAKTVDFEADDDDSASKAGVPDDSQIAKHELPLWGVEAGEPIPLQWEDLMPEGAEEELIRQQEEFFAMLEQRYAASATSLADAQPFNQIEEGSSMDYMPQFGNFDTVESLDGQLVRIPGYVVPFDFNENRRQTEFLFVPYMGACIHTPPPPPNQIIFVHADPGVKIGDIWAPYWLEGTLSGEANQNEVGDAAYSLALDKLEPYQNR